MKTSLRIIFVLALIFLLSVSLISCNGSGGGGDSSGVSEESTYYADADGDGYGDPDDSTEEESQPEGYVTDNTDCDDTDASINPGAEEIPDDGIDNNCDGLFAKTYYADADGDGYGDPDISVEDTSQPEGYVLDDTDCDDTDSDINPDAVEVCGDGIDNNCDGDVDELRVPEDYDTIQGAIDAASYGCDVLVNDGTYTENIDYLGKAITIKSVNGAESTIIDGNSEGPVVTFDGVGGSVLEGFTITGGSAKSGGGIHCRLGSSITINDCIINGNSAADRGGGIFCDIFSSVTINDCIITGNSAYKGGGIFCGYESSVTITDSTITGNSATLNGGGIYCDNFSSVTITDCTISNNMVKNLEADYIYSLQGGGIYCRNRSLVTITNCIISNNILENPDENPAGNLNHSKGGGICSAPDSLVIVTNCTITGNSAGEYGGGISSPRTSLIMVNSIVWGNTAELQHDDIFLFYDEGSPINIFNSNIGDLGLWDGINGNIKADPLFVDDTSEDISLRDYHLTADSPCIDAGTDTFFIDEENIVPTDDIDGDARPQGAGIDMGSDEYTD